MQESDKIFLKNFSSFKIGGAAKYYIPIEKEDDWKEAFLFIKEKKFRRFFVLGNGTNCLFDTKGFSGTILHNKTNFLKIFSRNKVFVSSGYSLSKLGFLTSEKNFSGLEFGCQIPATVGGAIYMNASAFGYSIFDVIESVDFMGLNGERKKFLKKDIKHGYRYSIFQSLKGAIISATFSLKVSKKAATVRKSLLAKRKRNIPVGNGIGSIFKNPKGLFAGKLIEECGFKGKRIGGAIVSTKHANFIINEKRAKSLDVLQLIELIKQGVKKKYQIDLEEEISYLPYE